MAAMFRPRHSSRRTRGRHDSGDTDVPLDLGRAPEENVRDILVNIVKTSGSSRGRKLGHLNNFVKILKNVSSETDLGIKLPELICCLRLSLLHEAKEVRAGGLRALRYLITNVETLQVLLKYHIDILVARCIDINQNNEVERAQALRFMRKIITVCPELFPRSLANTIVAIGNDGGHERDRLLRSSVATICELALKNIEIISECGGINTILHNILDSQLSRVNESLVFTILYLLNQPQTRKYIKSDVDLEKILAPYTDIHYHHTFQIPDAHISDDRHARCLASRMAIVTMFRSWPGMIRLCRPDASGLCSFLGVLSVPNEDLRKGVMDVLYEIFSLPIPEWTDNFNIALLSSDPSQEHVSWKLSAGFVVEEAKRVLPHRAMTRSNLVENHIALILQAFIGAGLLESLVEVITTGEQHLSIRATILLGELLHMANTLLPYECGHHSHCLPTLMTIAASFDVPPIERVRASIAVNRLNRFHEMKKRGPVPSSLFLDQIMKYTREHKIDTQLTERLSHEKLIKAIYKDYDDPVGQAIRDSMVISTSQHQAWNWNIITALLKWPSTSLRRLDDTVNLRFIRRLIQFFKPSSCLYDNIELSVLDSDKYSVAGIQLVDFLLTCEEEGEKILSELMQEIVDCLADTLKRTPQSADAIFGSHKVTHNLSQHYFLFIGKLTTTLSGEKILEKTGLFQHLLDLCSSQSHEYLIKLVITSLDYTRDSLSRIILSKVLSSAPENVRQYATSHLRVLLRAQAPFFTNWGMELLVTQLYDKNRAIAIEAIDILDEACEVEANLHALVQMRPSLLHMGDKGVLLLIRFLSIPKGFKCLSDVNFVTHELEKWKKTFNKKYVIIVEAELNESFTSYQRPPSDGQVMRRSSEPKQRQRDVFVPVHLYGQLVQHKAGSDLLDKQDAVPELSRSVRYPELDQEGILNLKAAIWGLGHIGSSIWGLKLLLQEEIIADIIRLAEECEIYSIRGTCFYVLGMIAKTKNGADLLRSLGWESVRHSRKDIWPVVEEDDDLLDKGGSFLPDYPSMSSIHSNIESPHYSDAVPFLGSGDRTSDGSPSSTFFLDINEHGEHHLVKGADKSPGGSTTSPIRDKLGFPFYQVDVDNRNRSTNNAALRKYIAMSKERDIPRDSELSKSAGKLKRNVTSPILRSTSMHGSPTREVKLRSNSDSRTQMVSEEMSGKLRSSSSVDFKCNTLPKQRSQSFKYRSNSNESSGRGSTDTKSRSESFTETVTSGISSLNSIQSNPSFELTTESNSSVSTISSLQTFKTVHSSDFARKQVNLKRTPSFTRRFSSPITSLSPPGGKSFTLPPGVHLNTNKSTIVEANAVYTTTRDAQGYAALKNLKKIRAESMSDNVDVISWSGFPLCSPPKAGFGRSNTYTGRLASLGEGSTTSLESVDSTKKSRSLTQKPHSTSGGGGDYVGLCLPVDVNMIFQVDDPPSKITSSGIHRHGGPLSVLSPVSEKCLTSVDAQVSTTTSMAPQFSLTQAAETLRQQVRERKISRMESGFEAHAIDKCLLCTKVRIKSFAVTIEEYTADIGRLRALSEADDSVLPSSAEHYAEPSSGTTPQSSLVKSLSLTKSPCSSDMTPSSASSDDSTPAFKKLTEDSPLGRSLIKKEIVRLVVNLSSSVAMKAQEQGLLSLKERFPNAFQDVCLYSDIADILGNYSFRLGARRFVQELFQDMVFSEMYADARAILQITEAEMAKMENETIL
ncbi:rapamycin-insensitive companion of mTOR-like [Saccoglossus kowalevskii]|uniref:Rapamycin-insensitive companion of mTOR-like n=1 Tax=Saccoglossus kowalevskii TaxID=10224 RepID=A0ABM0H0S3_SACKO|nr:PREDICTED: rapamycin-insensitive companion of mTOR-like [Saccoglossus kowalevskii]